MIRVAILRRPWEAAGVSRATWYRQRRRIREDLRAGVLDGLRIEVLEELLEELRKRSKESAGAAKERRKKGKREGKGT